RGEVSFPAGMVGDFVILRSNGLPTYNFAAAVDDSLMGITHVIRGGEHLANTLRQVMIYEALSMEMPVFAHIPLILGSDGSKLSKRHGAPNIRDYRDKGYPPEALVNYLAFLGWATRGESEILSPVQLIEEFELDRVSDSPSTFDDAKLNWVSANHIRAGGADGFFEAAKRFFPDKMRESYDDEALREIFEIIADNLPAFSMIPAEAAPFMPGVPVYGEEGTAVMAGAGRVLEAFADAFASVGGWDPDSIRGAIKAVGKECGVKGKDLYMPLRIAVTGASHGPDLTSIIRIRGREETVSVLRAAASGGLPGKG
ncbi:MAG TPA: glutamate--tRNA ligase family protein, partial [Candidatus Krumholzibacterium sp.]|nr:glutamate--tRNA ligase family protein [Candidatus Krumholzibacterium sp.]